MEIINVLDDGNCLFRCVATFLDKDFAIAERFKNGRIKARKLDYYEEEKARALRIISLESLKLQKHKYEDNIFYNDTELYDSLDKRIEKMYDNNEFAGLLELKMLSKILKINFNIYVKRETENIPINNLVVSLGKKYKNKCNLLLEDSHYNLIIWS